MKNEDIVRLHKEFQCRLEQVKKAEKDATEVER